VVVLPSLFVKKNDPGLSPLRALKNGRLCSADFDMNMFNVAILPVSFYTFFLVDGSTIEIIAFIFSGLA
jgi:hypothetical protein